MEPEQYRQSLIEQGYSEAEATNFTQTYYPEFQSGAVAPAPAAPGFAAPMGGGFAAPVSGVAAGGSAAGTAAVAAGGSKVVTLSIVAVLLAGGGTAGYFIWDAYFNEDLHDGVYWWSQGYGISFEDDDLTMVMPQVDGDCDMYEEDSDYESVTKSDGLCFLAMDFEVVEWNDHDDGEELCIDENAGNDEDDGLECMVITVRDGGAIMYTEDDDRDTICQIMIKDIENPPERNSDDSYEDTAEKMDSWMEDFFDKAKEIGNDDPPSACDDAEWSPDITGDYVNPYELQNNEQNEVEMYVFGDADAAGNMSNGTGDALVEVTIIQCSGCNLNWALLKVTISVEGGTPIVCSDGLGSDDTAACTWTPFESSDGSYQYWEVAEGITISEGNDTDLCDGADGGCQINITITKAGVGSDSDKVLASVNAYADASE
jgi:hypothetical protein